MSSATGPTRAAWATATGLCRPGSADRALPTGLCRPGSADRAVSTGLCQVAELADAAGQINTTRQVTVPRGLSRRALPSDESSLSIPASTPQLALIAGQLPPQLLRSLFVSWAVVGFHRFRLWPA